MEKVIFMGAGPGAPDLLTIRGKEYLAEADVVVYAGSLVNPGLLSYCKDGAKICNSAAMTLKEITDVLAETAGEDKKAVRLHSGDPSVYGAMQEELRCLDRLGIPYEIVPGVSSFLAAAASLKREYTLPGVSQTVILTRMEGRTAVPESESIRSLASHQASMVIFLSTVHIRSLCTQLIEGGYPPDTPAAVVYKASWEDEKTVRGTLLNIAEKTERAQITSTALILVGRFLEDDFENSRLYDENFEHSFRKVRKGASPATKEGQKKHHARRLMIQGTMSSAGKSFVCAALCRILKQDGYSVAPFKSQNMALNSYLSADGLEIGRAQAMQAEAAGIEIIPEINPILLKPTGDQDSQVIVRGEVLGNMSASEYNDMKAGLIPVIEEALERLNAEYDVVIIEGAGSPAEINLKENDIVNMGMARMADAPVILVADIDRGGVFAQIVGTVELLEPDERARVKGIIINKFRGDKDLLRPGIEPIEKRLGIPVLGIIPMEKIDLDDEDSLSARLENEGSALRNSGNEDLDIRVIRFPHISNFTDLSILERMEGVSLSYASDKKTLGEPDVIILPGTKNTMADLAWLKDKGLADEIVSMAGSGKVRVIGICGGYQMLGETLYDPKGVEGGNQETMEGLGLLPVKTTFYDKKTRSRTSGILTDEAAKVYAPDITDKTLTGYEIHMGKTEPVPGADGAVPLISYPKGESEGWALSDGLCFGTYMHGLFDNVSWTKSFLGAIALEKGRTLPGKPEDVGSYKERQYDKLADLVRCSIDLDAVYRILDESLDDVEE